MQKIDSNKISKIRYIKLGTGGKWEKSCIENDNTIRLGYIPINAGKTASESTEIHNECLVGNFESHRKLWSQKSINNHIRQIRDFYLCGEDTLWITFYKSKLYWAICSNIVEEDQNPEFLGSRFRKIISNRGKWNCTDIDGAELNMENLGGRITKTAGYRGTICAVSDEMKDYLIKKINGENFKNI